MCTVRVRPLRGEAGNGALALARSRRCRIVEHLLDGVAALGRLFEALRVDRRAVDAAVLAETTIAPARTRRAAGGRVRT